MGHIPFIWDMEIQSLIQRIEAYCDLHGVKETMFGRKVADDGKLLRRLRGGGTITIGTLNLIEAQLGLPPDQSAREIEAQAKETAA